DDIAGRTLAIGEQLPVNFSSKAVAAVDTAAYLRKRLLSMVALSQLFGGNQVLFSISVPTPDQEPSPVTKATRISASSSSTNCKSMLAYFSHCWAYYLRSE